MSAHARRAAADSDSLAAARHAHVSASQMLREAIFFEAAALADRLQIEPARAAAFLLGECGLGPEAELS